MRAALTGLLLLLALPLFAAPPKLCWAHYVAWGFDQVNGYDLAALDPVRGFQKFNDRSLLGRHAQTDEGVGEATKLQVRTALQYGIDGFCVDLIIREDSRETFYADAMERFFRAAEGTAFKVAPCVDSTAPAADPMARAFAAYLRRWGGHPNTCLVDGKPVIFIYNSRPRTLADWKAILAALKAQGLEAYWLVQPMGEGTLWENPQALADNLAVFDGFYDFGINGFTPEQMRTRLANGRAALEQHRPGGLLVAGITQGYLGNGNSFYRPYLNTGTLRDNWEAAIKVDAPWVCVTTWNDYVEHTHFEPSAVNRDALLRINRDCAARWRGTPVPPRPPQPIVSYHEESILGEDWTLEVLSLPYTTAPAAVRVRLLAADGAPAFEPAPVALPADRIHAETLRVPHLGLEGARLFRVQAQLATDASTNAWQELYPVAVRPGHLESLRTIHIPLDSLAAQPSLTLDGEAGKRAALVRFSRWNLAGKVELLRNGWPVAETEIAHKGAPAVTVRLPLPDQDATPADLYVARYTTLSGDVAWSAPGRLASADGTAAESQPVIVTGTDFDAGWWGEKSPGHVAPQLRDAAIRRDEVYALTYPMDEGNGAELISVSGWRAALLLGRHHKWLQKNAAWTPQWTTAGVRPALRFDGTNDCAVLPSRAMPYGPFTLEMNVCPELKGAPMALFADPCGVSLSLTADGHVRFARQRDAAISRQALANGRWVHLAARYDGARLTLDVNGAQDAEAPAAASLVRINSLPVIGNDGGSTEGFRGLIGGLHLQSGVRPPGRFVLRPR